MDEFDRKLLFIAAVSMGLILLFGGLTLYDTLFIKPIASNNANSYCRSLGFDQYKSFSRVGLFSINPVGTKCEYAEKYTDLGVRVNT